jgi:riboflavin kinase/FMN adenylyltransferase
MTRFVTLNVSGAGAGSAEAPKVSLVSPARGSVVTVGTFDGVHRGHQAVLDEVRARALASGRSSVLLTFDPHPLAIVRPEHAPQLLTTQDEKRAALAQSGLDLVVFLRFTPSLATYSPERFVDEILQERLAVRELVIGYDHGFGRDRSGNADTLRHIGAQRGFAVDVVAPFALQGAPVSSSRMRSALADGDVETARTGLGRNYTLSGRVLRGEGRGRALGFPTANLGEIDAAKLIPEVGVYAVWALIEGERHAAALHIGPRPTFEGATASIEAHLLHVSADLYGARMQIEFVSRLRPVQRFESTEALMDQLARDIGTVRRLLLE